MVLMPSKATDITVLPPEVPHSQDVTKEQETDAVRRPRRDSSVPRPSQDAELKDYQLGDCLGKGAHGSVFRALNMNTGETVAVKQIKLADLPKSELRVITLEIDLLKNLDHPNIVKYIGFVKSSESLNIILEYCENGSLHSISKNFGKFPENLVALYMSQVLNGLLYLHEQGVIHRDIKGANILTTKQGLVKLADFGVATRTTTLHESSVVGTPYWMAPEVIELSGATTASDVWSLGCTVIELLDGKPPYHKLQPMHALFRIVNDDHPPMPEGASPIVRDFLTQCFQKDPNLRVSARKLLKHPWIVNASRSDSVVPKKATKYEEAVKSVQEWNEALKSPEATLRKASRNASASPVPPRRAPAGSAGIPNRNNHALSKSKAMAPQLMPAEGSEEDNWDNDFDSAITPSALHLPHLKPQDHYGGLLSADKLKAFASFETVAEEGNWDDDFEGEMTVKSPVQVTATDVLKTVRPYKPEKSSSNPSSPVKSPRKPTHSRKHSETRPRGLKKTKSESHGHVRSTSSFQEDDYDGFDDLILANIGVFDKTLALSKKNNRSPETAKRSERMLATPSMQPPSISASLRRGPPKPRASMRRTRSSIEMQRYVESDQDAGFSDVFAKDSTPIDTPISETAPLVGSLMLTAKLSNNSWLGDEEDEDDPFAELEDGFDETDLDANVARDKYARLCTQVEALVSSLKISQPDETLADITEELLEIVFENADTRSVCVSAHGMLPILELLETCKRRDIVANLLRLVNLIIAENVEIQENLCFVGGIPIITKFASRRYSSDIRIEAATFVRQICETSTLTLQMFVSAGGLKVLVEFLEEDYYDERDLVMIGVNGVWSVFELQGPTPKNDFCRILSRSSVLDPLSLVLSRVLDERGEQAELCEGRIANIFVLFSQAENHVKELIAERTVLHRILKELKRMSPTHQVTMLKFIKNLSMLSTTLDALQNSNAIDVLIELLKTSMDAPYFREISNQVLNTIYNLCRLNKSRQEDAALNDIIPILQRIYKTDRPLKEFTLPILCDMAHSGKVGRRELWRNKGLHFYMSLLSEPYWQVTALDSIFIWLQEETARVEEYLVGGAFTNAITICFIDSKANAFENLLEPLQKLLRLSPPVAHSLAKNDFFARIHSKLSSNKALTRLNLLRIVQCICDASEDQGALISQYGLYDTILRLADSDSAILVRDMASKLIRSCDDNEIIVRSGGKRRAGLRRASSSTTPPSLTSSTSMPPTPTSSRSTAYILDRERSRNSLLNLNAHLPYRTMTRDRERDRSVIETESRSTTPTTTSTTSSSNLSTIATPTISRAASRISTVSSNDTSQPSSSHGPGTGKSRLPRTSIAPGTPSGTTATTGRASRQSTVHASNRREDQQTAHSHSHRSTTSAGGASASGSGTHGISTRTSNRVAAIKQDAGNQSSVRDRNAKQQQQQTHQDDDNGPVVVVPSSRRRRLQQ